MISTPEIVPANEQLAVTIHLVIPRHQTDRYIEPAVKEVLQVMGEQGVQPAVPMFSYHHRGPSGSFDFEIGFPEVRAIADKGRVVNSALSAERVARIVYQGQYEGLSQAWQSCRHGFVIRICLGPVASLSAT